MGASGELEGADAAVAAAGVEGPDAAVVVAGRKGLPSGPGMNRAPFWPQPASITIDTTSSPPATTGNRLVVLAVLDGIGACRLLGARVAAVRHKLPASGS